MHDERSRQRHRERQPPPGRRRPEPNEDLISILHMMQNRGPEYLDRVSDYELWRAGGDRQMVQQLYKKYHEPRRRAMLEEQAPQPTMVDTTPVGFGRLRSKLMEDAY